MSISICIPSFLGTKEDITEVFNKIGIGKINEIMIKQKGKFQVAFIYLEKWNLQKPVIQRIYKTLCDGEEINLVYKFPWFWKCRANHDITELKFKKLNKENKKTNEKLTNLENKLWILRDYTKYLQQQNLKTPQSII